MTCRAICGRECVQAVPLVLVCYIRLFIDVHGVGAAANVAGVEAGRQASIVPASEERVLFRPRCKRMLATRKRL